MNGIVANVADKSRQAKDTEIWRLRIMVMMIL